LIEGRAMKKHAITFSCDAGYFPLLKGLILSLRRDGGGWDDVALYLADVGCSPADVAWAEAHGVTVKEFRSADHYDLPPFVAENPRYASLLYRGVIPTLFPGHEVYLHVDADVWMQNAHAAILYLETAARHPTRVVIAPCVDSSYMSEFTKSQAHVLANTAVCAAVYDPETAAAQVCRPVLSAGVFAAHRTHRIWRDWRAEMETAYGKEYDVELCRAGADQTTLNRLLHDKLDFIPLSARFNYNCHVGFPVRRGEDGRVVIGFPPHDPIDVMHLTCFGSYKDMYRKHGLLFDRGAYLTDGDWATLGLTPPEPV
jgi:hypothetical protein